MSTFADLGVEDSFSEKLKERSITEPTAVQSLVIPRLLAGENTAFRSETGTGKTFAYLLPALQKLPKPSSNDSYRGPAVLICAPTLELCSQIKTEIDFLSGEKKSISGGALLLIGSSRVEKQIETLKKSRPAVIVGNPGRLLVLAKMGKIKFSALKYLILDEADRLTVPECIEETTELLETIGRYAKDVCLAACSATISAKTIGHLGTLFASVEITESSDHEILRERIEHWALFSERRKKVQALRSLLSALKGKKSRIKVLIFTSRGDEADKILSQLQHHGISAAGLFAKANKKPMTGTERKAAIDAFREGRVEVLISTDLAARGLDIQGITHVVSLDVPSDGEVYIHRCGRTGRAGKRGIMITIGDETQMRLLAAMEKRLKIRIQPKELYGGKICVPEIED